MEEKKANKTVNAVIIFLIIWGFIQILRFVAIPLIMAILNKTENEAWMFPAIMDCVVAAASFYFIYLLWKKRNFAAWMYIILYLSISILDHLDGAVAAAFTVAPVFFGGPERSRISLIISLMLPAAIDAVGLYLISTLRIRNKFFKLAE